MCSAIFVYVLRARSTNSEALTPSWPKTMVVAVLFWSIWQSPDRVLIRVKIIVIIPRALIIKRSSDKMYVTMYNKSLATYTQYMCAPWQKGIFGWTGVNNTTDVEIDLPVIKPSSHVNKLNVLMLKMAQLDWWKTKYSSSYSILFIFVTDASSWNLSF